MVYVDPQDLGYKPFLQRWIAKWPETEQQNFITEIFDHLLGPVLSFLQIGPHGPSKSSPKMTVPQTDLNVVRKHLVPFLFLIFNI